MRNDDPNRKIYIYGLVDSENPDIIKYVGWTYNYKNRISQHIYEATHPEKTSNGHTHKNRWVRKVLDEGRNVLLNILEENIYKNWEERERHWIKYFGRENLTNGTDGGFTDGKWKSNKYSQIPSKYKIKLNLKSLVKKRHYDNFRCINEIVFGKDLSLTDNNLINYFNEKYNKGLVFSTNKEYIESELFKLYDKIDALSVRLSLGDFDFYYLMFKEYDFSETLLYTGIESDSFLPCFETFVEYYLQDENGYYDDNIENHNREDAEWVRLMVLDAEGKLKYDSENDIFIELE